MANQISTQTISFNNQSLITVEQNGNHYVAMKPICKILGLHGNLKYYVSNVMKFFLKV